MRRLRARRRAEGKRELRQWVVAEETQVWSDHRVLDIRSLALHALVARRLVREPQLVERARAVLDRWAAAEPGRSDAVSRWRRVLDLPADHIALFLTSTTPEATELRQSSPFATLLPDDERRLLLDAFRERR